MSAETTADFKNGAGAALLWACVLAGPLAALAQLQADYALVLWVCGSGQGWTLHAVSLLALLVCALAGALAWRNWRRAGARWEDDGAGALPRSRFMSVVGMLVSAHSALVVIAQWVAVFIYSPCQRT